MKNFRIKVVTEDDRIEAEADSAEESVVRSLAIFLKVYFGMNEVTADRVALSAFLKMEDRNVDFFMVACVDEVAVELYKL